MADKREARRKGSGWIVAIPVMVRRRLKLTDPGPVYWHLGRRGEGVLTMSPTRGAGGPDTTGILNDLADARKLIDRLRQRDASIERARYAEGYALGRQDEHDVLARPTSKRANELRRRARAFRAWGARIPAGYVAIEKVPAPVLEAAPAPEENQDAGGVLVASAEAARDLIQGSDSPAPAEE